MKVSLLDKIISKTGQIAILIDPEKTNSADKLNELISRIHQHQVDYIFIGGSSCTNMEFEKTASIIKPLTNIPIIIFPGSSSQITKNADGILLLSLLSGRNSKYLIEEHIDSSLKLRKSVLEIIPTSYILINGETESSVKKISNTIPLSRNDSKTILNLHAFEPYNRQEQVRMFYPVINSKTIISETSQLNNMPKCIIESDILNISKVILSVCKTNLWIDFGIQAEENFKKTSEEKIKQYNA